MPAITDLPASIAALARQWPAGAYEAEGEAFHQHWLGRGHRRADWAALWASRVQARHDAVMRSAKAGVVYAAAGSVASQAAPWSEPDHRQAPRGCALGRVARCAGRAVGSAPVGAMVRPGGPDLRRKRRPGRGGPDRFQPHPARNRACRIHRGRARHSRPGRRLDPVHRRQRRNTGKRKKGSQRG
jgi:hypothetical protein